MAITVSSSTRSIISGRNSRQLEKVFAEQATGEQKAIDHALKDVKQAEKALHKYSKSVHKAEKLIPKAKKKEAIAAKLLSKVLHKHANALKGQSQAESKLNRKREQEVVTDRSTEQVKADLDAYHRTMVANARDRVARLTEAREQFGEIMYEI